MSVRHFEKSSYSSNGANCVEASAPEGIDFKKSSHSDDAGGACVEVGAAPEQLLLRDSKNESGGPLIEVSPAAFMAFTAFVGGLAVEQSSHIEA